MVKNYFKKIPKIPSTSFRVTSTTEYRPNLVSDDIGLDSHNLPLTGYLTINDATNIWYGPRHPAYNSKPALMISYANWPHGINPYPDSLRKAVFYFSGKNHIHNHYSSITLFYKNTTLIVFKYTLVIRVLQVGAI